jgi:tetraacyldisaccharide 4'-kinase
MASRDMAEQPPESTLPTACSPLPGFLARSFATRLVAACYGAAVALRNAAFDRLPSLSQATQRPVISIGSIRAGGTGKTPLALRTGKYLLSKGCAVAFLSRGYGRKDRAVRIVKPHETVSWELIGDEPHLLHERLPESWLGIGADRRTAAAALVKQLPPRAAFVLDDGFQHRGLRRDLDIICLPGSLLCDRLLPQGYLREPVASIARSHAIVVIGSADTAATLKEQCRQLSARFPTIPVLLMFQEMGQWVNAGSGATASRPPIENPFLVCGIARPERFIAMVLKSGITPCGQEIFPDHHCYGTNDFIKTRKLYSNGIITTEKDAVRLKKLGVVPAHAIWYLSIGLRFADTGYERRFDSLIDKIIQ